MYFVNLNNSFRSCFDTASSASLLRPTQYDTIISLRRGKEEDRVILSSRQTKHQGNK